MDQAFAFDIVKFSHLSITYIDDFHAVMVIVTVIVVAVVPQIDNMMINGLFQNFIFSRH